MKKLLVLVLAMMLLVGCSQQKKDTTFMVTRDNTLYALYIIKMEKDSQSIVIKHLKK